MVVVGVSAAQARHSGARVSRLSSIGGSRVRPAAKRVSHSAATPRVARAAVTAKVAHEVLVAALAPLLKRHTGDLAVGVVDRTTGVSAMYDGARRFHTASIVKADILATLLLRRQRSGTCLDRDEHELAAQMIEDSDNDAASDLWQDVDQAEGVSGANVSLGLTHTRPGAGGYWGLTSTTVSDQLKLLSDLVSPGSPLTAVSRSYELGLMRRVEPAQSWGVTAAATSKTRSAVKNGWLPDPQLWVVNSIGVIHHAGQVVLVAVLSNEQPTEACGIAQDEAAAVAAVDAITAAHS